jgi:hypothetical protein
MTRNWMRKLALPGLAAVLAVTACEKQVTGPQTEVSPAAPSFAKGGNGKGQSKEHAKGPKVKDQKTGRAYGLVTGHLPAGEVKTEKVIGPEGGWLGVSGHYVYVSPGAVAQPTEFKIQQFKQFLGEDSTVIVGVSLKAEVENEDGSDRDVGAAGFAAPVYLFLDASWADEFDVENTTVLWLKGGSEAEAVAKVTRNGKWYVATLEHFSDYGLGDPGIVGRTIGTVGGLLF